MDLSLYRKVLVVLFLLFLVANGAYLHRVPGLLGDEASEGENVFELLDTKQFTVIGERSYIGPMADYLRVPFILTFGYNALALRALMFLFSIATFGLAAVSLRRLFGAELSLFMLAAIMFSPAYLLYQRLGWAITLFPFFLFLVLFFVTSSYRNASLLAGLSAGFGLANHIVFLPTLAGVVAGSFAYTVPLLFRKPAAAARRYIQQWPAIVGFLTGFGMQFVVLMLYREDQGDPAAVAELVRERWTALPALLPLVVSGSSFVAAYTGVEFSPLGVFGITWALMLLSVIGVLVALITPLLLRHRVVLHEERVHYTRVPLAAIAWVAGLTVYLVALLYTIDRFTLRYFVVFVLGVWALAGLGVGCVSWWLLRRASQWFAALPVTLALLLSLWMMWAVLIPFLQTGGSTNNFSLGNRTDSAAAFIDVNPLIACLRSAGPVFSENIHIWNRLRYVSHGDSTLDVVSEGDVQRAQWLLHYRLPTDSGQLPDRCPQLRHFRIEAVVQR